MNVCDTNHDPIVHSNGEVCPLCDALDALVQYEDFGSPEEIGEALERLKDYQVLAEDPADLADSHAVWNELESEYCGAAGPGNFVSRGRRAATAIKELLEELEDLRSRIGGAVRATALG